jgi:hypothetical protein
MTKARSNAVANAAKGDLTVGSGTNTSAILALGADGSSIVADSGTATGLRYQGSQVAGRNCIINGGMDIWQRGITFTGAQYGCDRWHSSSGSNTYTITRETGISSFQYALKIALTGSNSFSQIGTQIEFANCYLLQNQPVTISFYAQANNANAGSTTLTVRTRTIAAVDGACLFAGAAASSNVTLTTSPLRYSVTRTLPTTFGSLSLEFQSGAGVSTDGFTITGIQMELGSVPSAFSRTGGTIQGELAACQRYYVRVTAGTTNYNPLTGNGAAASSTEIALTFQPPTTMRTAPTSIEYASLSVYGGGTTGFGFLSVSALTLTRATSAMLELSAAVTGATTGASYRLQPNNAASYVGVIAEL